MIQRHERQKWCCRTSTYTFFRVSWKTKKQIYFANLNGDWVGDAKNLEPSKKQKESQTHQVKKWDTNKEKKSVNINLNTGKMSNLYLNKEITEVVNPYQIKEKSIKNKSNVRYVMRDIQSTVFSDQQAEFCGNVNMVLMYIWQKDPKALILPWNDVDYKIPPLNKSSQIPSNKTGSKASWPNLSY